MNLLLRIMIQVTLIRRCLSVYIKYDTGNLTMFFNDVGQKCYSAAGSNSFTSTIIFNGLFANTPQLMIFIQNFDLSRYISEFTYSVLDKNKNNYTVHVQCLQANPLFTYIIQWIAVDDDRIQVLNQFNNNVAGQGSQTYTLPHSLPDAAIGFAILTNWGQNGILNFSIQIQSITSSAVTVNFTNGIANLLSVGYSVVLGTLEAFQASSMIQKPFSADSQFIQSLTKPSGYMLVIPIVGYTWTLTSQNIRMRTFWSDSPTTTTYTLKVWGATAYDYYNYHEVWFNLQNSRVRVPLLLEKWRVSKKKDYTNSKNQIYIKEKNQYFTIGYYDSIIFDDIFSTINIVTSLRCSPVFQVTGSVLNCIDCIKKTQDIQVNCYGGMNLVEHYFKFAQKDQVYQKLTINITDTTITVLQSVIGIYDTVIQLQLVKL